MVIVTKPNEVSVSIPDSAVFFTVSLFHHLLLIVCVQTEDGGWAFTMVESQFF